MGGNSGECLRALCGLTKLWFTGMHKGKHLLNHWVPKTTDCVTSSNSSSALGFISCLPSSLLNSLELSLENTTFLISVVKERARHWNTFLLLSSFQPGKPDSSPGLWSAWLNWAFVCSNICKRWIPYFPAGAFAVILSFICVTR